ncbi:acyl carrier protein [Skermania sp. ID1734]|uniref:acyl carrier protein n=1 Tax=Skermania sp. ID1734 TaxID=2597516 RepID=UPI00117D13C2|nr:acyl carrier protein [Skermania sp. ID1734]TSE00490.1 acyl carrier protein [Skermania sp. ID1734]
MTEEMIRKVLERNGRLLTPATELAADADLYRAGLSSQASVSVMLALEESFDIEFPDQLLRKSTFASIDAIRAALTELGVE